MLPKSLPIIARLLKNVPSAGYRMCELFSQMGENWTGLRGPDNSVT